MFSLMHWWCFWITSHHRSKYEISVYCLLNLEIPYYILHTFEILGDDIPESTDLKTERIIISGMMLNRVNNQETTMPRGFTKVNCDGEVSITFEVRKAFIYCFSDFILNGQEIQFGFTNFDKSQELSKWHQKRRLVSTRYWPTYDKLQF